MMKINLKLDPAAIRHAAEITADYAINAHDPAVAKVTLDMLDALEVAMERQGAASLVRDQLESVISNDE
jgi:hypothetical protein